MRTDTNEQTTDAPTSASADYLRKRHMSEGVRRRSLRADLPPSLRDLSDTELDDRNARIWATVQRSCQVAAGVEPDAFPRLFSGSTTGQAYRDAQRAALRICANRYGIPATRLAEIAETSRPWVSSVLRQADPRADSLVIRWEGLGGPAKVDGVDLVPILVTREVADVARSLTRDGDAGTIISAAILAVLRKRSKRARWSADDDRLLRKLCAAGVDAETIAQLLGRTAKAITIRRQRHGL